MELIKANTINHYHKIRELYQSSFPECEKKPFRLIKYKQRHILNYEHVTNLKLEAFLTELTLSSICSTQYQQQLIKSLLTLFITVEMG